MEDIFQQALEGKENAVRGLYACSVTSAYKAVFSAVGEEEKAVEIVKEIYISAFQSAKTYDEFFAALNKRAEKACKILVDKNALISEIEPTESVFFDVASSALPPELKPFSSSLSAIVIGAQSEKQEKKKAAKKPLKKEKNAKPKNELKEFDEMVKKHEFSKFDTYKPEEEPELQKPKTLAEKLQPEESVVSNEQLTKEIIEREKNKRASLIAFIFAGIILIGAVATYFVTGNIKEHHPIVKPEQTTQAEQKKEQPKKLYTAEQGDLAFRDYLNEVLVPQEGLASDQRIVAYDETSEIGTEQLNGLVSAKKMDIDGDKQPEYLSVKLNVRSDNAVYVYTYYLNIYRFEDLELRPVCEAYRLLEYRSYNRGGEYNICNFMFFLKILSTSRGTCLFAEGWSRDMKIYSYHFLENGTLHLADEYVYLNADEHASVYLQKNSDGTFIPLCATLFGDCTNSVRAFNEEEQKAVSDYGFTLGTYETKFQTEEEVISYVNKLSKQFGSTVDKDFNISFPGEKTPAYICFLKAQNVQGDLMTRKEVVAIRDFTDLKSQLREQ